jgi:hypothetical protein
MYQFRLLLSFLMKQPIADYQADNDNGRCADDDFWTSGILVDDNHGAGCANHPDDNGGNLFLGHVGSGCPQVGQTVAIAGISPGMVTA